MSKKRRNTGAKSARKKVRKAKKTKSNRVYLGVRVPDTGNPGLDRVSEVRAITRAIELDYRLGRITRTLALRRLSLLKLAVMRDSDFQSEPKRSHAITLIDRALKRIKSKRR